MPVQNFAAIPAKNHANNELSYHGTTHRTKGDFLENEPKATKLAPIPQDAAHMIAATLKNPLLYLLAFAITGSESSLFASLVSNDLRVAESIFSATCPIATFLALFALSKRRLSIASKKACGFTACGFGACCAALSFAAQGGANEVYFVFLNITGSSISFAILLVGAFEILASTKINNAKWTIAVASMLNAALSPIAVSFPTQTLLVAYAGVSLCLAAIKPMPVESTRRANKKAKIAFPVDLACGLGILSMCFGFLQSFLYQNGEAEAVPIILSTKIAAVVLFLVAMQHFNNMGYSMLARIVATISIASFSVFLATGGPTPLASAGMATGYSLLEITLYLVIVDLSLTSTAHRTRIICSLFLIDSVAYYTGEAITLAPHEWFGGIAAFFTVMLAITGIWLFNEKRVNAFLWKQIEQDTQSKPSFEDKARAVAAHSALSERETEILLLFAQGRSAVFISDLIFISANTVRTHIKHIYIKLNVHSRQELIDRIEQSE